MDDAHAVFSSVILTDTLAFFDRILEPDWLSSVAGDVFNDCLMQAEGSVDAMHLENAAIQVETALSAGVSTIINNRLRDNLVVPEEIAKHNIRSYVIPTSVDSDHPLYDTTVSNMLAEAAKQDGREYSGNYLAFLLVVENIPYDPESVNFIDNTSYYIEPIDLM